MCCKFKQQHLHTRKRQCLSATLNKSQRPRMHARRCVPPRLTSVRQLTQIFCRAAFQSSRRWHGSWRSLPAEELTTTHTLSATYLQLTTAGFCWWKVLLPACPCWRQPAHWIRQKTLEFSSTVLSALSPQLTVSVPLLSCLQKLPV